MYDEKDLYPGWMMSNWASIGTNIGTTAADSTIDATAYTSTAATDVETLKRQIETILRKEMMVEMTTAKSAIEWTISEGTTALIARQSNFQYGMRYWSVIKTTHSNHFTMHDLYSPDLADWFVSELVKEIDATEEQVKFFAKEDWVICCKVS